MCSPSVSGLAPVTERGTVPVSAMEPVPVMAPARARGWRSMAA
ncbi:hypothetical protein [uncultured Sphingomonas sp.]